MDSERSYRSTRERRRGTFPVLSLSSLGWRSRERSGARSWTPVRYRENALFLASRARGLGNRFRDGCHRAGDGKGESEG